MLLPGSRNDNQQPNCSILALKSNQIFKKILKSDSVNAVR